MLPCTVMVASSTPSPARNVNPLSLPTLLRVNVPWSRGQRHLDGQVAGIRVADGNGISGGVENIRV